MGDASFPRSTRGRLRWAVREGIVIAGVLAFWLAAALAFVLVLSLLALAIETLQLGALRFVHEFAGRGGFVWAAATQLAAATTALYVIVRAGTVLIDRYRAPVEG